MITKKKYLLFGLAIFFANSSFAHEPLYGLGPDVLFKGGINPHLTFNFNNRELERWSKIILWISFALLLIGFSVSYLLLPIMRLFE